MCDSKLLETMRPLQVKMNTIHCTCNSNCWCNQLSYRFPLDQSPERCLSPQEILDLDDIILSPTDIKYLNFLKHKTFLI